MKILDLFSGIGGFSLGLESTKWKTIAFCEINPSCHKVLSKYWPDVPIFEDVTKLSASDIASSVDVICGGFPCQDISVAGKKKGINGNRSGLWKEYLRLINEIKPKYAIIENVANLRSHGLITVLQDLWQIGYDAQWHCIPASALGAPHQRDRIWIIAYPNSQRCKCGWNNREERSIQIDKKWNNSKIYKKWSQWQSRIEPTCEILANSDGSRKVGIRRTNYTAKKEHRSRRVNNRGSRANDRGNNKPASYEKMADSNSKRLQRHREIGDFSQILTQETISLFYSSRGIKWWKTEPNIPRLAEGKLNPDWVEWLMGFPIGWTKGLTRKQRLVALGNALVPIIPEMIGFCINNFNQIGNE